MTFDEFYNLVCKNIQIAESKDFSAASTELLNMLTELSPDSSYQRYLYGDHLRRIGRCEEAEGILKDIREIPENKQYLLELSLGRLYQDTGHFLDAEKKFVRATQLNPGDTAPWVFLGSLLLHLGRFDESIKILQAGLQASGDIDEIHVNLGHCYRAKKDYARAREHYIRTLEMDPAYPHIKEDIEDVDMAIFVVEKLRPSLEGQIRGRS